MSVHILYRTYGHDGELLYVGITGNPPARFKHHKFNKDWWSQVANIRLEMCASHKALRLAEKNAILSERPIYNVHNNTAPRPEEPVRRPR